MDINILMSDTQHNQNKNFLFNFIKKEIFITEFKDQLQLQLLYIIIPIIIIIAIFNLFTTLIALFCFSYIKNIYY